MALVPFLFQTRVAYPCRYFSGRQDRTGHEIHLGGSYLLEAFQAEPGPRGFADLGMGWNEEGIAVQVEVRGKSQPLAFNPSSPPLSDGLSLWLDTRDSRTSHRASRFCHQMHFLPTGGGADQESPLFLQGRINRASGYPGPMNGVEVLRKGTRSGYRLTAWIPAGSLTGYDPSQNRRLGLFYMIRDADLGVQSPYPIEGLPVTEDPTLWSVLELVNE
jgi:hypothetical protein